MNTMQDIAIGVEADKSSTPAIPEPRRYVLGADRNNPNEAKAHWYVADAEGELWPMCDYGWNRSNGQSFSILRGWDSRRGICSICEKRGKENLPPIFTAKEHKTKWL